MIPSWLEKRYSILWEKYNTSQFRSEDASKLLQKKMHDSENQINVFLSELRKRGFLEVAFDPNDARKRLYTLKSKESVITETLTIDKEKLTRADLENLLKSAADLIRTRVDYTFILVILFYKRICDKWEMEFDDAYKDALSDGLSKEEAEIEAKNSIYHDFNIPEAYLWENIRKDPARLPENFSKAMKSLAENNVELRDVFENVDFVQFTSNRENAEILRQLVELFSARPLHHVSPDILGDAYEWILRYFAPQKAKEGEVYTAREVIKLIVEILDPESGESVYDPACGSGGMLIISFQHVQEEHGKEQAERLFIYGQEANHRTIALARMNLYIHDIRNINLMLGDTLLYPKFKDESGIQKHDIVIANPPWNQDGYNEDILKKGDFWKERFRYGFTPRQSADWAWIEHMVSSGKDDTGRVGVVIDNGCLFRGGKEKAIRMGVVNTDLIEVIILLPEKLFYNTGAPGAIIILKKNKERKRQGKILFINASNEFEKHPEVRKLNQLSDKNIKKIVSAYKEYQDEEGFSRAVDRKEIEENEYNLNVTLYVYPEEEIEEIDVMQEWKELKVIDREIGDVEKKIEGYLVELKEAGDV
jgi:type I restriction enzyme M protein